MRVAIFTDNDFRKINGVTTALRAVLEYAPADVQPRIYTCDDTGSDAPEYLALRSRGIGNPYYKEMRMYWPPFRRFLRRAAADGIEVIHYTTPGPVGLAAMWVASQLQLPMIGSFHTDLAEYTRVLSGSRCLGDLMQEYMRWPYSKCERILVPSESTRELLVLGHIDPAKIRIWRRGVSTQRFSPSRRSAALREYWNVSDARPALIYVGRLSKEKGLALLRPLQDRLTRAAVRPRFVFVGDGPMRAELEASFPDAVFSGTLPPDGVAEAMASADALLFPSRTDTAGNVVLEAQASGLPVLVSHVGGPRENMLPGETGAMCRDLEEFARETIALVSDSAKRARFSDAARRYALTRSWRTALHPLYRSYLDIGRSRRLPALGARPAGASVPSQWFATQFPGGASRLAALLGAQIFPIFSRLAPCHPGAALRDLCHDPLGRDTRPRAGSTPCWRTGGIIALMSRQIIHASRRIVCALFVLVAGAPALLRVQVPDTAVLQIRADQVAARVGPMLYGLMTEEINYSYDGGLYAELIRNRNFKEDPKEPVHWQLVQENGGTGSISLDSGQPFNDAIPVSLKLTVSQATGAQRVGVANDGFWGIPVKPNTRYRASFYARASAGFAGPVTVAIAGKNGAAVHAAARVGRITGLWQRYDVALTTGNLAPSTDNQFVLSTGSPGTVWFGMVSLFPPTWSNRPNGNRKDIMQLLADLKPAFLRFPGGNYLEGNTLSTRFAWKETIGDISQRPGHVNDSWRYWSSDGMGLLEFLEWCEDLHIEPVLAVYAGFGLRGGVRIKPGTDLQPYVIEALEEIEYVTGNTSTTWGARRARDGHPAPFPLQYVEIGNEDNFDREPGSYDGRFAQFFDAIKAKYPRLSVVATTSVTSRTSDVIDEHYYRRSEDEMASHAHDYDGRSRSGPKVFVGEWATRVGEPTPNMSAALGDAAWLTGMERNSDLVIMSCYAPLFVNVNKGGMQWRTDLIGYDGLNSYGSPAYYAQQMFSLHHGDVVLPVAAQGVPTREWQPPPGRGGTPGAAPTPQQVPTLFFDATRDSRTGTIYLKLVNRAGATQPVRVEIDGLAGIEPAGQMIAMSASSSEDTNSITEPRKIVPVTSDIDGLGARFTRTLPAYSITVLEIRVSSRTRG